MANDKVQVNGSSSGTDPALQSQITTALIQNGGIVRIQNILRHRLDEEGWSQALRNHAVQLFRSGEVTTYPEAEKKIYELINGVARANGAGGSQGPDLSIPLSAKEGGVDAVKRELHGICEMEK